jgi:hypothetical protein
MLSRSNRGTSQHYRDRLRKTTENLIQESRCPGRHSNRALSEYKSRALPLELPAQSEFTYGNKKMQETKKKVINALQAAQTNAGYA